ncbi:ABC transporter permease [Actinoplanes philippinensis]|uniref:Putative ABC transport system permease protein n=1 Tax=Actinoplanes philippinensis TaxID=35752 RepID=A0A1I2KRM7_9ACTN|nr:ABC transporter permease [Actinoplanes philippinensis]GIE82123.1 ABC transporter permease [Actinoplanes philippinensis]SFF69692.1 putative ABC transport system permease protein [Actinoplanes philippinensis]
MMNPVDLLSLGVVGLRTRPLRALLSGLGIAIGIATMIVVTGIPASSQAALVRELTALGTDTLQVMPVPDQQPPARLPESAVAMAKRIGPVRAASAVGNTHAAVRRSDRAEPTSGTGLTVLAARLDLPPVINARIASGRWLTAAGAEFPTVVLGSVAATRLGITAVTAGPQVLIGDRWFTVVGILAATPLSPDIDRSVLIGWDAARTELRFDGRPTVVYLRADESQLETVRSVLAESINPERPGQVLVTRPSDALAAKRATENSFSVLFLALAAVALVIGGIGVANTMVVSVLERRSEIGLRRALGATRGRIRAQFLTESMVLSTAGGLAGTALGLVATVAYAHWQNWPIVVPVQSAVVGVGGAVVIGVLAGVYPSVRAARLPPAQALH